MSYKTIEVKTTAQRIILIIAGLLCAAAVFFTVKWSFANTVASAADRKEVAEFSRDLAPNDPRTHYILAALYEKTFLPEDLQKAVEEYEKAAALSPNDFRMWFQLGRARERVGDSEGAEKALRQALALAPNYSEVQWTLGNILLRQGNAEEAYNLIRLAADGDDKFVNPAISTAWQIFDGDISQIRQNIGDSPKINAALVTFLVRQQRFGEAMEIWKALPAEEKRTAFKERGEEIYNLLAAAKKYRGALAVWSDIADTEKNLAVGKITNGGFETNVKQEKTSVFEWQIAEGLQPLVGVDKKNVHGGSLSRLIIFNSPNGEDFREHLQIVAVEAGKTYEFEMFYKSELKASGTLRWEIADASDGKILAATEAISANTDWTNLKTDFTTGENTEGVIIRLARVRCSSAICPITGNVWFDDLTLREK